MKIQKIKWSYKVKKKKREWQKRLRELKIKLRKKFKIGLKDMKNSKAKKV